MKLFISSLNSFIKTDTRIWADDIISDGVTLASDDINAFILNNYNGANKPIGIGRSLSNKYLLDLPILGTPDLDLIINGEFISRADPQLLLGADLMSGDSTITLASPAPNWLRAKMKIVVSDDLQPINGGGSYKTRLVGKTNTVKSISSDRLVITCELPFINSIAGIFDPGYLVSANARLSSANNIILLENVDNTIIRGTGLLNGNRPLKWDVVGTTANVHIEDINAHCGITYSKSKNQSFGGLDKSNRIKIMDCVNHGLATNSNNSSIKVDTGNYSHINIESVIDKSVLGFMCTNSVFYDIHVKDGIDEGGIEFYNGNKNCLIKECSATNSRRHGFANLNIDNEFVHFEDCIESGSGVYGLYIQNQQSGTPTLPTCKVTNFTSYGSKYSAGVIVVNSCKNVLMDGINIYDRTTTSSLIASIANAGSSLKNEDITFKNININNCRGTYGYVFSIENNDRLTVENFNIDFIRTLFNNSIGNVDCWFIDGVVTHALYTYNNNNSVLNFDNVSITLD